MRGTIGTRRLGMMGSPMESAGSEFEEMNKAFLLFKGEGDEHEWSLYAWGAAKGTRHGGPADSESFLTHRCAHAEKVAEVYVYPDTHKACWRCQAPLPAGLKAVWILHNGVI